MRDDHGALDIVQDAMLKLAEKYADRPAPELPLLFQRILQNVEGWPGIDSPTVKDFIADHQITASGWFVANPQVTVVDTRRLQRTEDAVNTFLDQMAGRTDLDEDTAAALKQLTDTISTPEAVDY